MGQVWESWGSVLVAWAIGVVVMPVIVASLAWYRIRIGVPRRIAFRHSLIEMGIVVSTAPWVWMILTPTGGVRAISPVPFRDFVETLGELSIDTVVQIGANTVVFLPLGFLLPMRVPRCSGVLRMFVLGAVLSSVLEIAQYVLDIGRVSSIDDVLMNATGAGIGAYLLAVFRRRRGGEGARGPQIGALRHQRS